MKVSTKGRYALRIMLDLAFHNSGELVPLKDIAKRQNITLKYMEQIISPLSKAGFVISTVYTALTAAVLIPCAPWFFRIFTTDAEVISIAVPFCRITAAFAPVLGMVFIYQNLLRSCSDIAPTVWMSITEVLSRAVLPFVFSALWGYTGIWWATPVGWTASAIIGYLRFRSGKWKEKSRRTQERLERA